MFGFVPFTADTVLQLVFAITLKGGSAGLMSAEEIREGNYYFLMSLMVPIVLLSLYFICCEGVQIVRALSGCHTNIGTTLRVRKVSCPFCLPHRLCGNIATALWRRYITLWNMANLSIHITATLSVVFVWMQLAYDSQE